MTAPVNDLATVTVAGLPVEFSDSGGDGEVVLLVHAGVFGAWFEPLATEPVLAPHRVVRILRPGYTSGRRPAGPVSVAAHAAACTGLLDHLRVASAHLVAHSSGSVIALQCALDRPDLVRSLVLSEPPLIDSLADPVDLDLLHSTVGPLVGDAIGAALSGDVAGAYDTFMHVICGPEHRTVVEQALGPRGLERAVHDSGFFFADEAGAVATWSAADDAFDRLRRPALLVLGADSPPPVHRLVNRTAGRLHTAEVVIVDGENHLLPLRSPDRLAGLVSRWVQSAVRR